jgi:DNA-binding NtrC family response regulator
MREGYGNSMKRLIILMGTESKETQTLIRFLEAERFQVEIETPQQDISPLSRLIKEEGCRAVIIDLDDLSFESHYFRDLKRQNPKLNVIGLSEKPFHPELAEAISNHIYACLKKPVDTDEISYLLKGVFNNTEESEMHDPSVRGNET